MRDIYLDNELGDEWLFWGYRLDAMDQMAVALLRLLLREPSTLSNTSCADAPPSLRLLAELHYSYKSTRDVLATFGPQSPVRHVAPRCNCRVVLFTRLRHPFKLYVSFYRWTVGWRQQLNSSVFGSGLSRLMIF